MAPLLHRVAIIIMLVNVVSEMTHYISNKTINNAHLLNTSNLIQLMQLMTADTIHSVWLGISFSITASSKAHYNHYFLSYHNSGLSVVSQPYTSLRIINCSLSRKLLIKQKQSKLHSTNGKLGHFKY